MINVLLTFVVKNLVFQLIFPRNVIIGASNLHLSHVTNDEANLVGNKLTSNHDHITQEQTDAYVFPSWVSTRDRKLLQSRRHLHLSQGDHLHVAQDGSGQYQTINEAIHVASKISRRRGRLVIHVKEGIYNEIVHIGKKLSNIILLGDGIGRTIIVGSKRVIEGTTTFSSATVGVDGKGFMAKGITFQNTAGPQYRGVALRSSADMSVFYQCSFEGYQDTLYVHTGRQFYRECDIYGSIDFIFGRASVVFQNCIIYVRNGNVGHGHVITAQGNDEPSDPGAISIQDSRVLPANDFDSTKNKAFLGRPWKKYARTVYIRTYLDSIIHPEGWMRWDDNVNFDNTVYYGEYENIGPGASTTGRVKWPGYHDITSPSEVSPFTIENLINGKSWLPFTSVPFRTDI